MNKRDFVLAGCTTLTTGVVLSTPAKPLLPGVARTTRRLERFPDLQASPGMATWRKYVGERFQQLVSGDALAVVLRRVVHRNAGEHGEQFTLLFANANVDGNPNGMLKPMGTQLLRHATTGQQIPVFLQSAGSDPDGLMLYRADFNRKG